MRFRSVRLESLGYVLPEEILTSVAIEHRLAPLYEKLAWETGKLEALTGIQERRVWPVGTKPSLLASQAAQEALKKSALGKEQIDLVIHTGVCRDWLEPSTANVVHHTLGLSPHCLAFDVSNACLGFFNGLLTAANMIELGQIQAALVVSGENAGPLYEDTLQLLLTNPTEELYRKCLANLTLGSGAVACILTTPDLAPRGGVFLGGVGQTYSAGHDLCKGYGDVQHHLMMETQTTELMRHGLVLAHITWELFCRDMEWAYDTPAHILTHQISLTHHQRFFQMLDLDLSKGAPHCTRLGNTGSVAAPLALAMSANPPPYWPEAGRTLTPQDPIALLGIGSGINTMMLGLLW
jgi:3-oxoacyl-[acyl-carrier-protein] synthase-3